MTQASIFANQATAIGDLISMQIKSIPRRNPQPGQAANLEFLEAEIGCQGSRIKITVWPTKKKPTLHQDINRTITTGKKVIARGSLQEQVNESGKIFRGIQAWTLEYAGPTDTDKLVYFLAGHLGHPAKTAGNGQDVVVVPVTVVREYDNAAGERQQQETTIHIHPDEQMLKTLYAKVSPGKVIQSRGYIVNKASYDEFGVMEGYKSELTVAKLEVRDEANAMWLVVSDALPAVGAAPAAPPKPVNATPPKGDDDDVPF